MSAISLTVNGATHEVDVEPSTPLLYVLRNDLGLHGPRFGCGLAQCGACTVIVDGESVDSCLMLGVEADGAAITTVEGLASGDRLDPLQEAFLETGAAQCGFCIPGQLVSARALLDDVPHPTRTQIEEGLAGNLCRCAGYEQIMEAVELAATRGSAAEPAPHPRAVTTDVASTPDAKVAPQ
jgi:aerobic-type carbon monoxide dehydrogenase small subunit (CoxS/CutS family)